MSSEYFMLEKTFFIRFWGTDEKTCKKCENIHVFSYICIRTYLWK